MGQTKIINLIAMILLIIGGINWGLVGLANMDLVIMIFGGYPMIARIIYGLVGLSAIYVLLMLKKFLK